MAEPTQPLNAQLMRVGEGRQEAVPLDHGIFMSRDISNAYRIVTPAGDVLVNTGIVFNGDENFRRLSAVSNNPVAKIIFTQSHTDHIGGWRWFNPWFADLELALAPVVEDLDPDLIHAHDFHMVGIGARLAGALSTPERPVRWIYDAHEYLRGIEVPSRTDVRLRMRRRMLTGVEREYIGRADAVVTVSEGIATRLAGDHGLSMRPRVILNAPVIKPTPVGGSERTLRADCGLDGAHEDVPLLLYSGGMSPRRGVATAIEALVALPGVHLALIARADDPDVPGLRKCAADNNVADRLHVLPYVPVDQVVPYISSATIGLVPILHVPNHELSLITKYFEYLHAALPIVTSDVREMAATTRAMGVGEVFVAGDAASLAEAVRKVLAAPNRYRAVYQGADDPRPGSSWAGQAAKLDALYREVLGRWPGAAWAAGELELVPVEEVKENLQPAPTR